MTSVNTQILKAPTQGFGFCRSGIDPQSLCVPRFPQGLVKIDQLKEPLLSCFSGGNQDPRRVTSEAQIPSVSHSMVNQERTNSSSWLASEVNPQGQEWGETFVLFLCSKISLHPTLVNMHFIRWRNYLCECIFCSSLTAYSLIVTKATDFRQVEIYQQIVYLVHQ